MELGVCREGSPDGGGGTHVDRMRRERAGRGRVGWRASRVSVVSGGAGPWGYARERVLRCASRTVVLVPRRARCRGCAGTHVLLRDVALSRRRDEVSVIGAAVEAKATGVGHRRIAARLGVPKDTVRGWLRRFAAGAEAIRVHFARWAFVLAPELGPVLPAGGGFADALEQSRWRSGRGCCASARGRCGSGLGVVERRVVVQHELPLPAGAVSCDRARSCRRTGEERVDDSVRLEARTSAPLGACLVRVDPPLTSEVSERCVPSP